MGRVRMREMYEEFKFGLGYKAGDILKLRPNARHPFADDLVDGAVVVRHQSAVAPHQYDVVGERTSYRAPGDRFMMFQIDGHEWEKVGSV